MEDVVEFGKGYQILAFGIPSLDELLGQATSSDRVWTREGFGITLDKKTESTSLCIIGPDGTGKSVLALHLASHYASRASEDTRLLYASTDLSIGKARTIWSNFALDRPSDRIDGLEQILDQGRARAPKPAVEKSELFRVALDHYHPLIPSHAPQDGGALAARPLTDYLKERPRTLCSKHKVGRCHLSNPKRKEGEFDCHRVAYVDLESSTAGDDWALINRLLATLKRPADDEDRHLLIIDAVEGLETLGGQRDTFGLERERRSRIAQILRVAKGKCHVVFIVEEPKEKERLPEEFVSDAVIRLRVEQQRDYARRTIEIDKLRGQAYIRGQHDCQIRKGRGSRTGRESNADHLDFEIDGEIKSYFSVVHSLHYLSREIMHSALDDVTTPEPGNSPTTESAAEPQPAGDTPEGSTTEATEPPGEADGTMPKGSTKPSLASGDMRTYLVERQAEGLCGFGILYLDEMIGDLGRKVRDTSLARFSDEYGIPWGGIAALIGDEGTHKSRVGRAFLSKAFDVDWNNDDLDCTKENGVALLLTTQHTDRESLARQFLLHRGYTKEDIGTKDKVKKKKIDRLIEKIAARTSCRRLEIHHMTAVTLFQIVHALVQRGLRILLDGEDSRGQGREGLNYPPKDGRTIDPNLAHGRVRLVIDDWSGIQDTYPEIKNDPLFLPFLIFYLKRQGITTLIIDTQPGRLTHILSEESDRELRALCPYHIYTWHVRFFGETRVAIAALPPISDDKPVVVRELKPYDGREEELIVDPNFEYYDGFEDEQPQAIPLQVRLYQGAETPSSERGSLRYIEEVQELFTLLWGRDHSAPATDPTKALRAASSTSKVIQAVSSTEYDLLRDFVYLHGGSSLDHTLVVQLDEFWCTQYTAALSQLSEYLEAETYDGERPNKVEDPFLLFQPTVDTPLTESREVAQSVIEEAWPPQTYQEQTGEPEPAPGSEPADVRSRDFSKDDLPPEPKADVSGTASSNDPTAGEKKKNRERYTRRQAFDYVGYKHYEDEASSDPLVYRVPYTVDFGMILASHARWQACFEEEIPARETSTGGKIPSIKVRDIWNRLRTTPPLRSDGTLLPSLFVRPDCPVDTRWRDFFKACLLVSSRVVGEGPVVPAFDVDHTTAESLSCLVFEIWASELYQLAAPAGSIFLPTEGSKSLIPPVARRASEPRPVGLLELMEGDPLYRRALFRCWLLLSAVLSPDRLPRNSFRLSPSEKPTSGVASRHWYSTACRRISMSQPGFDEQLTPIRLPGWFTTRGDWDMAVSRGSRSRRLGERAIDILTSRRAQISRMQQGIGLPVRGFPNWEPKVEDGWVDAEFRSPLKGYDDVGGEYQLRLNRLWWLGGKPSVPGIFKKEASENYKFFWLFRSKIRHYERHSRIWSKWILYALERFHEDQVQSRTPGDLLNAYDDLPDASDSEAWNGSSNDFTAFNRYCTELRDTLRRSTIPGYGQTEPEQHLV